MARRDVFIFLILVITFLIWSNSFLAIGALRAHDLLTPMELVVLRFVPVGVISLAILLLFYRREAWALLRAHPGKVVVMGLLVVPGYNFCLNLGMSWINPAASSLLISLNPLFTLLLAIRFLGESYTPRRLGGTLLAFAGLAVVVLFGKVSVGGGQVITLAQVPYALAVVGASACWATNTIISKPLMGAHSPIVLNYLVLTVGTVPMALSAAHLWALAFLSIGCTVIAFALWFVALRYWKASNVSLFVYLNPPLTAIFDFLINGRHITAFFLLGGLIMLTGITLATRAPKRKPA